MGLTDEQRAIYKDFFKKADKDKSGFLTIEELHKALVKMGYTLTPDECAVSSSNRM